MFMQIAIGAIGIGVILMVGYIVISQVRGALPSAQTVQVINACRGMVDVGAVSPCINTSDTYTFPDCGDTNITAALNQTAILDCPNAGYASGTSAVQVTVFAGFGLVAVGIIVLAAFGLINIFK